MSEILAYCYECKRDDLRVLGARKLYIDTARTRRAEREQLISDVRRGDVVRVLRFVDLGGPQWKRWRNAIEAKGGTVEECRPTPKPRGRPRHWALTDEQDAAVRRAWLGDGGIDARLATVAAIIGQTVTRADRFRLYQRYGKPGAPKQTKEPQR